MWRDFGRSNFDNYEPPEWVRPPSEHQDTVAITTQPDDNGDLDEPPPQRQSHLWAFLIAAILIVLILRKVKHAQDNKRV